MPDSERNTANLKARANLLQVVQLTGAKLNNEEVPPGNDLRVDLCVGRHRFVVVPSQIYKMSPDGRLPLGQTCLRIQVSIPHDEHIASVLLLLKNDPTIFERWARQDTWYS